MEGTPTSRVRLLNDAPTRARPRTRHVLYWMVAHRRLGWNFALDRAVEHARALGLPLVILEAIRLEYPWASDRHHAFALAGMAEHAERIRGTGVTYHPYMEDAPGAGRGLLSAWARDAAVVVTDDFPAFFLPAMVARAAARLDVRVEAVDSNGLLPLSTAPGTFSAAVHLRRFLQRNLAEHLLEMPDPDPLPEAGLMAGEGIPEEILQRWPAAPRAVQGGFTRALSHLPIDHDVAPTALAGGTAAAREKLDGFIQSGLPRYLERNHPDAEGASGLSPYLHWGHLSVHEIFQAVAARESWSPARLSTRADGGKEGWWGMSAPAEAFLDELVTWRELGFVFCRLVPDYDRYETLPAWARETLADHAGDPRPYLYRYEDFRDARTHDELWNAAQRQLVADGVIHNYLRMLWGKKILEWSESPREALRIMLDLNNRYALDGRDPNSYSGIFWVLGRFDRGWPERPIYGKIRSMSSDATRRKVRLERYLARWGDHPGLDL